MSIKETNVKMLPIGQLVTNDGQIEGVPANPRQINKADFEKLKSSLRANDLTGVMPLKVYPKGEQYVVLGGNMRLRALQELGAAEVSCIVLPENTDVETLREVVIVDNSTFGEWDNDMLANEWDVQELSDWGVELLSEDEKNEYSRKVESPIYEPMMAAEPTIKECYSAERYHELIDEIEQSSVSDEEKAFLKLAAARHIVFDYANIAEKYARAGVEMQRLMEKNALVIIDFGSAIENGFVKMTKNLQKLIENVSAE